MRPKSDLVYETSYNQAFYYSIFAKETSRFTHGRCCSRVAAGTATAQAQGAGIHGGCVGVRCAVVSAGGCGGRSDADGFATGARPRRCGLLAHRRCVAVDRLALVLQGYLICSGGQAQRRRITSRAGRQPLNEAHHARVSVCGAGSAGHACSAAEPLKASSKCWHPQRVVRSQAKGTSLSHQGQALSQPPVKLPGID